MSIQNHVTSLELSKRLKELGVKQDSLWKWYVSKNKKNTILSNGGKLPQEYLYTYEECCSAYLASELGEMLKPYQIVEVNTHYGKETLVLYCHFSECVYRCGNHIKIEFLADTEADARAKMLIYLLENKLTGD